jgi:conjugal transfer/entry exclusion protein
VQAFEIEGLVGTGAAPAVLAYLFHRIGDRLDGRPTLLIIDEGWLALDDEGFAGQLREWLKTLRKKNASVIFATQSLSDIDGSGIAPAIIESCPTRLLLPNERAIEPQITAIYRRFGLNDRQIEILARATPKRDYYCQSRRGNRLFELGLSEVGLALCAASSKSDQTLIAQSRRRARPRRLPRRLARARDAGWAAISSRLSDLIPQPKRSPDHDDPSFRSRAACRSPQPCSRTARAVADAGDARARAIIVFDPSNYAQNVLTAARTLEQINQPDHLASERSADAHQPGRNLASLPFSALQQLQQNVQRTQQLLSQAQNIAFDVQQIDQMFQQQYGNVSMSATDQQLVADARSRWQNTVGGLQDAMRVQAGVVGNIDSNRTQMSALVSQSQGATGALAGDAGRQPASRAPIAAAFRSGRAARRQRPGAR